MVSEHRDLRRALGRECIAELLREVVPVPVPVPVPGPVSVPVPVPVPGPGRGNGHWPEFSASATRPEEEASRLLRARETVRGLGPGLFPSLAADLDAQVFAYFDLLETKAAESYAEAKKKAKAAKDAKEGSAPPQGAEKSEP